jgi:hypothetical protein
VPITQQFYTAISIPICFIYYVNKGGDYMGLLNAIVIILIILWLGGFLLHIAGAFIHILLVIAVVVFLMRFIKRAA